MSQITLEILDERLNNFFRENKEDHNTIITQTTKTNGRVSCLEVWKNRITGGMIVLNIFMVPTLMYLLFERLSGK
jgi:hypothetical protein